MEELKKMVLAVANSISSMKSELFARMDKLEEKVDSKADGKEMRKSFEKINGRLDKQGKSLACLEDDAPTVKEFDILEKRVTKVERNFAS